MSATATTAALHDDIGISLPLRGIRLIEASAGTGKTFTLATLYLRALVEDRRRASEVLVVTFTDAATIELRERLRHRLELARLELLAAAVQPIDDAWLDDDTTLDTDRRLTRLCLRHAVINDQTNRDAESDAGSGVDAVARLQDHLSLCLLDLDQAPIDTFHAFCRRALGEHAFASRHRLDPGELDGDDGPRLLEVADDLWRDMSRDGGWRCGAMAALWDRPEELARTLRELLASAAPLEPAATASTSAAAERELLAAYQNLKKLHAEDGAEALRAFNEGLPGLKKTSYKPAAVAAAWPRLRSLLTQDHPPESWPKPLHLLGQAWMAQQTKAKQQTPEHALFVAVDRLVEAIQAMAAARASDAVALLHELRAQAALRLAKLKTQRRVRSFDDLINDLAVALDDAHGGDALASALVKAHPLALIDEFQDTDERQWAIFRRIYRGVDAAGLLLIGDPKQAIYRFRGGDIFTYLRAADDAVEKRSLTHNFRSRPALISACNALFGHHHDPFADPAIHYSRVEPGGGVDDDDLLRDGEAPHAIEFWSPPVGDRALTRGGLDTIALRATVADIVGWLRDAASGTACVRDGTKSRALHASDIAVLVSTNRQAERVQRALAKAGVAAVCAGQQSLFGSNEAVELLRVLRALLRDGDGRALRAALATELIGCSATDIAALASNDGDPGRNSPIDLLRFTRWRRVWQRDGVLAVVEPLLAEAAPRLLRQWTGERQLANFLQLAETMDSARQSTHGIADQLRWLERKMTSADEADDSALLRLETDRARVQIMTVHKSKGLEFGIVYLPFIALHSSGPRGDKLQLIRYHDDQRELRLHARAGSVGDASEAAQTAMEQESREAVAESMRLVYVALTRARYAVRALWTLPARAPDRGLTRLFCADGLDHQNVPDCLDAIADSCPMAITHRRLPAQQEMPTLEGEAGSDGELLARHAAARATERWRRHSFSGLTRGQPHGSLMPAGAATDESDSEVAASVDAIATGGPGGKDFGNALHGMLEQIVFPDWRNSHGVLQRPANANQIATEQLRRQGISTSRGSDGVDPVAFSLALVDATLSTPLPSASATPLRLIDLSPTDFRAELEFELRLGPARSAAVLRCLQHYGYLKDASQLGTADTLLEGLLHGYIDLIYRHNGRFYVLDYKSNRLPRYDQATVTDAMRASRYDLQYLLYSVALHRWLSGRMGAAYDVEQHYGGAVYIFLRGRLGDGSQLPEDDSGVFFDRPPGTLLMALDALLDGEESAVTATSASTTPPTAGAAS